LRIGCVRFAELLVAKHYGESDQTAPFATSYRTSKHSQQKTHIDGVTNQRIWPAGDEFVAFLQGDGLARIDR